MKKLIILFILLTSCTSSEQKKYENYIELAKNANKLVETSHFDLELSIIPILDEYMYKLVIDNSKIDMQNIEAIIIHDQLTNDIFPSSGIFEKPFNIKPNYVNHDKNYVKGIILIGYLDNIQNTEFKIYLKYLNKSEEINVKGIVKPEE